jgi:FRG domain-containing protein
MSDVRVESWTELQEALFESSYQSAIARFRSNYVFRGAPRVTHGLETSLQTGGFESHERHLLTSFRKYALRSAVHGDSVWNWLSLGKHHGLPTRLLDWTYSPYVAMHFATENFGHFDEDAAIWCVDFRETNEMLPKPLRAILETNDANIFTTEMLHEVARTLPEFDALSKKEFVLFFEPPSLDERIVNQFALFSLPSSATASLEDLLQKREATYRRIIIPASLKWEVRDKLDQANITERVLFPGLDGLSLWLKRYFTTPASLAQTKKAAARPPRS